MSIARTVVFCMDGRVSVDPSWACDAEDKPELLHKYGRALGCLLQVICHRPEPYCYSNGML